MHWKKKKKSFFVLPQTSTYLPKGCYSYLNVKNKTLPWHGISGLPSSERSLAFSNVKGIHFPRFEPTDCTYCWRSLKSLSCWLCWAQCRSASLGLLEGEDHELHCIQEAQERPGTLGEGKRRMDLWGMCHSTRNESLFTVELLALVAVTAVGALHCQASLLCTSELQALGLLWGWSRHRAIHGRRLFKEAGQSWSPAHYTYVCRGKLGYFWLRVVRVKHGSLLSCWRPGGKSLLSLWPWSDSGPLPQTWCLLRWLPNSFWSGTDASCLHPKPPQVSRGCHADGKNSCFNTLPLLLWWVSLSICQRNCKPIVPGPKVCKTIQLSSYQPFWCFQLIFFPHDFNLGKLLWTALPAVLHIPMFLQGEQEQGEVYLPFYGHGWDWKKALLHCLRLLIHTALPLKQHNRLLSFLSVYSHVYYKWLKSVFNS